MRIIFIEFHWQVDEILKDKDKFKNDVIISLDQETSYLLMRNKIKYFETYEFCEHEQLWQKYRDLTANSLKIAKVLDDVLWDVDERYKELKWNLFDDYHYVIKVLYDQLYYYSELIYQSINKYNPTEIWVADSTSIEITSDCLIPYNVSIFKFLLTNIEDKNKELKINYMSNINKEKISYQFYKIFINKLKYFANERYKGSWQGRSLGFQMIFREKLKNFLFKINFLFYYYLSKPKYISVGCYEISIFKKLYPADSNKFISYRHDNLNDKKLKKNWNYFEKFVNRLKNNTNFEKLMTHRSINFEPIFYKILFKLVKRLDFFVGEYNKSKKIVKNLKPLSVIFQTMSPLYSPNIVFKKICKDLKIPFVTWTHGGIGLTNSLLHYDVLDYRLSKNIISWGGHLKELSKDNACILNRLNLQKEINFFSVGSVRLDYLYKKYFKKNITIKKSKPILTFVAGAFQRKNQYYFGYNRKQAGSLWLTDYKILEMLKKYQNRYKIIFKDYPHVGSPNLWKKVLKDMNANNITYISNQKNLHELLNISDLVILPTMSSTFFDALYFDADIFVVEEDIFEKPFEQQLKDEIFYFNDNDTFKLHLEKYLEQGEFYRNKKKKSRNYFLNFDEINNRDKLLNETLQFISKN